MTWFQNPLVWSRTGNYGTSWELQMPLGVPIAAGVLALLALLALASHCLKEAWKSRWRLCNGAGGALQLERACSVSSSTARIRASWEASLQSPRAHSCLLHCPSEDPTGTRTDARL